MRFFSNLFSALITVTAAVVISSCATLKKAITEKELTEHIRYLSSDSLKGRLTGTPGDSMAAGYIKKIFAEYGLVPLTGDGFQRFKVTDRIETGKNNMLKADSVSYTAGTDFTPVSFSSTGEAKGEVVFCGYGFTIDTDTIKWNDYSGADMKGKWALLLRADPDPDNPNSPYISYSNDRNKAMIAKDMGAAGVLLVSGQAFDNTDTFDPLSKDTYSVGIPVIRIRRQVADAILKRSGNTVDALEKKLMSSRKPNTLSTGSVVAGSSEILNHLTNTRNVVMMLEGSDEKLRNEYVILGAHFDHLGLGGPGSGSRAVDTTGVHQGADDNASGVALLLELAGRFAGTKEGHRRSLVFAAFTGEEVGMFGSKYFTENPVSSLSSADIMLNFDMVGRLKDTRELSVAGIGTADSLKERVMTVADTTKLRFVFTEEGYGPSDHSAFYSKNIPVLFITTGGHDDYHTPRDTWDKINYKGMVHIGDAAFSIVSMLANEDKKLVFKEAGPKADPNRAQRRRGLTLGIMPDVTGSVKNGLRADGVTPGKPAAIGGMKKGDIIISIEGKPVNNIGDYMYRMGQLKKGQTITVEVMRKNTKEVLIIQL